MLKTVPTKKFLAQLSELTDSNAHGECAYQIACWGRDNSVAQENKAVFSLYADLLKRFNKAHIELGYVPDYELRLEISKSCEALIEEVFGEDTLKMINAAC